MRSFQGTRLMDLRLGQGTVWMLETLAEAKGRQQLYEHQSPQLLRSLREVALIESAESSNRIEGVTVERARLRPLVLDDAMPKSRPEEEIVGYRRALNWIHTGYAEIPFDPRMLRQLHKLAQGGTTGDAGEWKQRSNDIVELFADGHREVRFRPLAPEYVATAVDELCLSYRDAVDHRRVSGLVAAAAMVLDVTCIHPFRDGNGRVSRLVTLLALYQLGYHVGRYISLERIIEQTKDDYYAALKASSIGWHEGTHDVMPWLSYLLSTVRMAYREFEERASRMRPERGEKSDLVDAALGTMTGAFAISDIERLCPNVSRELVRRVMNRWRDEGRLEVVSRGRDARWKPTP